MTIFLLQSFRVIHIFSAITLVGFIVFNTVVLQPALKRIPPAHSTVVSQKIGFGMMVGGALSLVLLGVTGIGRLWLMGTLGNLASFDFLLGPYGRWLALMVLGWAFLMVTGGLSGYWYQAVLTKKLEYSAGLRQLEEKRAAQELVTLWQDRLYYWNVVAAVLAALGGAMTKF
jgi:hypothetical protein